MRLQDVNQWVWMLYCSQNVTNVVAWKQIKGNLRLVNALWYRGESGMWLPRNCYLCYAEFVLGNMKIYLAFHINKQQEFETLHERQNPFVLQGKCYCWCPGNTRSQGNSKNCIENLFTQDIPVTTPVGLISLWKIYSICLPKYEYSPITGGNVVCYRYRMMKMET